MMDWHRLSLLLEMINNGDSNHSSDSVLLRHTPVAYCAWHILKSKFKWKYDTTNKICWDVTFLSLFSCCANPVFVFWLGLGKVQWLGSVKYFKISFFVTANTAGYCYDVALRISSGLTPPPPRQKAQIILVHTIYCRYMCLPNTSTHTQTSMQRHRRESTYMSSYCSYAAYAVMIDHIFSAWCFFQRRIERLGGVLDRPFATRHATTGATVSYRTSTFTPPGWDSLHLYLQTPCEVSKLPYILLPASLSSFGSTFHQHRLLHTECL